MTPLALELRVHLAHASITRLMDAAGVRALHLKGYAAEPGLYREGRTSTDVDILVPPTDADRACAALADHGWDRIAGFSEGSIFQHAATLWHSHLGYVDVHRSFPGLGPDPALTFERLWTTHTTRVIAGRPVPVPGLTHQRLVIVVHAARDSGRGRSDVAHLRHTLSAEEWGRLRGEAESLGAGAAWRAATGEGGGPADASEERIFAALQADEAGVDLLAARWAAATGPRARLALVRRAIPVNRPHLQMRLGRPPTRVDIAREQLGRVRELIAWALRRAGGRG
ncbi:Uncharacterised nucleotidyltransferase [Micrococcus luteus]|uniref:Uncharacterized nucleotidyltransferase n=1 Tax=Micrococcus luteus TaxID=1270 RepID=A0ABD7M5I7_MICLU|nr:nucleotidyltransferase family protein [Micrococcus luteus]SHL37277.1 Uncharacterised nucleotidyltransferase [Micrococcus luteus]